MGLERLSENFRAKRSPGVAFALIESAYHRFQRGRSHRSCFETSGSLASGGSWNTSRHWPGMSRALLKLSGSLVHDYATISDDSPSPNRASRARRAATSAGIS